MNFIEKVYLGAIDTTYQLLEANKNNWTEIEYTTYLENARKEFEEMTLADFICDYLEEDAEYNFNINITNNSEPSWVMVPLENAKILTEEQVKALGLKENQ